MRGDWTDYWNFGCAASPVATARNQQAKPLLEAAGVLGGHAGCWHAALDKVDLYDEHTCGYYDSDHAHPQAQTTEILKQALAHEGHEHAAFALMDGLERLAGNPPADKGIGAGAAGQSRDRSRSPCGRNCPPHGLPRTPASERSYRASRMFYDGRSWGERFPGANARAFGPVELPPFHGGSSSH